MPRYDRDLTIHGVFEAQASATPSRTAVVLPGRAGLPDRTLSYGELNQRADRLANEIARLGGGPGSLVATYMERSLETIVAFLGILKAGAAYVPLDPAYPAERIAFMLDDTAAPVLFTQSGLASDIPSTRAAVLSLDDGWGAGDANVPPAASAPAARAPSDGGSLAYVIYTSGSTGRPKGVCVPHRGVVRLVVDNPYASFDASRVFLQLAPVSFDAATLEIWGPLLNGGTCVLYPTCGVPDFGELEAIVTRTGVTTLWITSSLFNLIIDRAPRTLHRAQEVLTGGEALSVAHIRRALELLPDTQLINGYGPTECTTFATTYRIPRTLDSTLSSIPIGRAIAHTELFILDGDRRAVPDGEVGDLYIGGDGLATCYLNRPDLTAERFVPNPFAAGEGARLYWTGDRVRRLSDGALEFCGRLDDQVKISGHRIELGEIETALGEVPGVKQAVVVAREDQPGDKRLVAYVTGRGKTAGKLRAALEGRLPCYMVPAAFVVLDAIPLSPMGKVDRAALPKPGRKRPDLEREYVAPTTSVERFLARLWSEILEVEPVGAHDPFFELGGTSLQALRFIAKLGEELGRPVSVVAFFEAPTVAEIAVVLLRDFRDALTQRLGPGATEPSSVPTTSREQQRRATDLGAAATDIAIIGLAGRFPGAPTADLFWQNLRDGVESTRPVTAEDLARQGLDPSLLSNPDYVRLCFHLEEAECFDAAFFGMTPREVELMDPQQRIFLETAYAALENAGYDPSRFDGRIGVFGGIGRNPYLYENIARRPEYASRLIDHALQMGNERDFPPTHVAYKLNLRGPAINVQTACSTTGVALHLACQSLREGDSDIVLVGGAKVLVPTLAGYEYVDGGALAPDGHIRAFDAAAGGMVRGSGCGFIVAKRLDDALRDGDHVRAIVKSTAINNDGNAKIGFTAPSIQGQSDVIARALELAGLGADDIQYVEAHGTGTIIGDPMEVAGLTRAYRRTTQERGYCALGSVKTNIGHLDAGAMIAGLIKTVLALENELLPPSLNFQTPNPAIDFESSPFFVNREARPWPRSATPRRAGVSAFGLGGTNAHAILEEAPRSATPAPGRSRQLLVVSAKTETALTRVRTDLARHLLSPVGALQSLADVAFTLGVGRRRMPFRAAVVATTAEEAAAILESGDAALCDVLHDGPEATPVAFLFPGGGAQYARMASGLYQEEPAFRTVIDECAALLRKHLSVDVRQLLYPEPGAQTLDLERPQYALPALFAVEYAVATLLQSWGVTPTSMIGHSMGEYTAACLAGVMTLEQALGVVACRGALFEKLAPGGMLSVPLSADEVTRFMSPSLSIAAINRPNQCVVSGPVEAIEAMQAALSSSEVEAVRVHIHVAAHSPSVDPILKEFSDFLRRQTFEAPRIPFLSNVTGTWITETQARDPDYWVRHLRQTVRFADGLDALMTDGDDRGPSPGALVEIGPGRTLSTFAKHHPSAKGRSIVATMRHPHEEVSDLAFLERSIGKLWLAGARVDFDGLYRNEARRRVPLPSYPFERRRHFLEHVPLTPPPEPLNRSGPPTPDPAPAVNAVASESTVLRENAPMATTNRKDRIVCELQRILQELSGLEPERINPSATFLELGFDSLFLTQANGAFRKRFGVKTTVRQLIEKAPGVGPLAELLDAQMPADAFPEAPSTQAAPPPAAVAQPSTSTTSATAPAPTIGPPIVPAVFASPLAAGTPGPGGGYSTGAAPNATTVERVIQQQLALMQDQLATLRGSPIAATLLAQPALPAQAPVEVAPTAPTTTATVVASAAVAPEKKANKEAPWQPVEKSHEASGLSAEQQSHIDALISSVVARAKTSKEMTQEHRAHFADPRTVQGFRMQWKDMVFPIVAARTAGSKLWDVDGNEYIDLVNGYGSTFLGHNPKFVTDAVLAQIERGVEIGPQSYLAGKLARLVCDLTGMDRAAFCNTGSEAVLAAVRLARTVTGKDGIATFAGHYHGIFDEVLVKGVNFGGKRKTVPIAPGIPQRAVEKTLVLQYGDLASLDAIREHADELALVLVEPIRSRNPDNQPVEFVQKLRALTEELNIALLFDEMVTGFRAHPGGMQALWGIKADLATYGKVVGGGYPIGVVTGKSRFMDALDGGFWRYGDASVPEADMTWFAGTFVRHPVAMAAAYATLSHLKEQGPALQAKLNERTTAFTREMNAYFQETEAPLWMEHFSSFFVLKFTSFQDYSALLFYHLHNRGVFTYEGRPAFFTTSHSEEDFVKIALAIKESVAELQRVKLLPGNPVETEPRVTPMSEGQQEIWLATRFGHDASCAFNLSSTLHLRGRLRIAELTTAVRLLAKRHEALRCVPNADGLTQRVMPSWDVEVPLVDLSAAGSERDARLDELKRREVTEEFDFDHGPLFRAQIVRLSEEVHVVILTAHHLIADGWSCGVMCRDLGKLYASICDGKPHGLQEAMPYSAWITLQQSASVSAERRAAEEYWVSQYSGRPVPVLDLPTDRPRPSVKTFAADRINLKLDEAFTTGLRKMAGQQGATLFAGVLAGFHVLLSRLSGQSDVVIGFSLAGQSDIEGKDLVGHCVQFLPLRLSFDDGQPFSAHVKDVRGKVFDAFENKNFTFGTLIKRLKVPRDPSRVPLMSVAFNLDPSSLGIGFHDLQCTPGSIPRRFENFDIFFNLVESTSGLEIQCTFNLDLFDRETMRRRLDQYKFLLDNAVRDAQTPCGKLAIVPDAERERILVEFNATETVVPRAARLADVVAETSARTPDAIAVRGSRDQLSYRQLEARSNQVAHYLQSRGVGVGRRVGVCAPRCPDLLVGLLGVLKSGAAYVPIDPALPSPRIAFMLEDASVEVVLSHTSVAPRLQGRGPDPVASPSCVKTVLALDSAAAELDGLPTSPVPSRSADDSVAYVAYTSGSTGQPKGVMVPERAMMHYLTWAVARYRMEDGSGSPVHSSIGFDLTVTALFGPLFAGKTVHLLDEEHDVESLGRALRDPGGFSLTKVTPAHLGILGDQLSPQILGRTSRSIVVGGEQLLASHVAAFRRHAPNVTLYNEYGPTETTVGCCVHVISESSPMNGPIPIGRPTPGTKLYVLDAQRMPVPIGVTGEIYIGGPQVALGYLNRPNLTAERFVEDPFSKAPGDRLYRTGDLARYRADGELEYLGRSDKQVKIRGYRIELGEIEAAIKSSAQIEDAVVLARGATGETRTLSAFVLAAKLATTSPESVYGAQKEAWKKKWDALYEAGAQALKSQGEANGELDDLVLLRELSDKSGYEAEVHEGLDATFARLRELRLGRVWAIGCGTGAELLRLAPHCKEIYGTDYAEGGIREIERLLGTPKYAPLKNVRVQVRDADDFEGVAAGAYDTVIINSVSQYFPDGDYLRRVLRGAVRAVGSGGSVFIGDVQSLELLQAHHAHDQLTRSRADMSAQELQQLVARRVQTEDELVVDPSFFHQLAREMPEIGWVDVQLRRGNIQNETTRFHYDVWLRVGSPPATHPASWQPFTSTGWSSADDLSRALQSTRPEVLCISNVPNWRNAEHVDAARLIAEANERGLSDVSSIREALRRRSGERTARGIDPMALWAIADTLPYDVELRWTDVDGSESFDAVFVRRGSSAPRIPLRARPAIEDDPDAWWHVHANQPAKKHAARKLTDELRELCRTKLPDYMVPSSFIVIDHLPLTHNGKVDTAALAAMDDASGRDTRARFEPPQSDVEHEVASVWCEVLGIPKVGLRDNFFEIGGHSLLGIQIIVRLRETLDVPELSLSSLFSTPTVGSLSQKIESMRYQKTARSTPTADDREELAF